MIPRKRAYRVVGPNPSNHVVIAVTSPVAKGRITIAEPSRRIAFSSAITHSAASVSACIKGATAGTRLIAHPPQSKGGRPYRLAHAETAAHPHPGHNDPEHMGLGPCCLLVNAIAVTDRWLGSSHRRHIFRPPGVMSVKRSSRCDR